MISTITPSLNFQSQGDLLTAKFRIYIASFQEYFETRKMNPCFSYDFSLTAFTPQMITQSTGENGGHLTRTVY
jgi:hypothetical protein